VAFVVLGSFVNRFRGTCECADERPRRRAEATYHHKHKLGMFFHVPVRASLLLSGTGGANRFGKAVGK
jgi:hypothetical protein